TPEVFLDPNTFSPDGTTGLTAIEFTKDGSLAAYLISEGGSDWRKVIVIETSTKKIVEDTLADVKFSNIAWKGNEGFFYSRYDKPKGSELSAMTESHKLYYHKLGTPQSADQVIFGNEKKRRYVYGLVTEDQRFLVISARISTTGNELYVQDLRDPAGKIITIVDNFNNNHDLVTSDGEKLIVITNLNAPNNRLVE